MESCGDVRPHPLIRKYLKVRLGWKFTCYHPSRALCIRLYCYGSEDHEINIRALNHYQVLSMSLEPFDPDEYLDSSSDDSDDASDSTGTESALTGL